MDIAFEALVNQVSSDVYTAEKLQSMEVYRHRRDYTKKDS